MPPWSTAPRCCWRGIYGMAVAGRGPTRARRQHARRRRAPGTTSTRPRTASGCRSAPSSRDSTRSWSRSWARRARLPKQQDRKGWPELQERFAEAIAAQDARRMGGGLRGQRRLRRPRAGHGRGGDHPHNMARGTFVGATGVLQPGPAPRFSRTKAEMGPPGRPRGADSEAVLATGALRPPRSPS